MLPGGVPAAGASLPSVSNRPVDLPAEEIWEICGALALAESMLRRAGLAPEAAAMAATVERVEARFAR